MTFKGRHVPWLATETFAVGVKNELDEGDGSLFLYLQENWLQID